MNLSKKAEITRQHILDTGRELVLRKGFVGVGLTEILKASGVPKGSFYHYFASKEAFGCVLLEQYVEDYRRHLDLLLAEGSGNGYQRLMRYWANGLEPGGWTDDCLVVKLAAEVADLSDDMRQILDSGVQRLVARLAKVIEQGRADGSVPGGAPAQALAQVLYQMWLGAALLSKLGQTQIPLQQALRASEQLLRCQAPAAPDNVDVR